VRIDGGGRVSGVTKIMNCTNAVSFTYLAVYGCTNSSASNFNPLATVNDGSCNLNVTLPGCTYPFASNFNATATTNDGSCRLPSNVVAGCTCRLGSNYDPGATLDTGVCDYSSTVPGCTYVAANNYMFAATVDDGSCQFPNVTEIREEYQALLDAQCGSNDSVAVLSSTNLGLTTQLQAMAMSLSQTQGTVLQQARALTEAATTISSLNTSLIATTATLMAAQAEVARLTALLSSTQSTLATTQVRLTGCATGSSCVHHSDCLSLHCLAGTCASVSCFDGVMNGNEAGIDCGVELLLWSRAWLALIAACQWL
jgi:hypothetical protein